MWSPLRSAFTHRFNNAPEELPGNGFSSCVNHLMLMVVEGVPLPTTNVASQENSRWRFDDSEAGGVDYSANSRRYLSSQRESLVITSHATSEALMTER